MTDRTHVERELTIEELDGDNELRLVFKGKSNDREPGRFLMPLLLDALERSMRQRRRLTLDFCELTYMNSSSFTPIVKLLDHASKGGHRLQIEYAAGRKWQSLSFSAMQSFATPDGRISVRAR